MSRFKNMSIIDITTKSTCDYFKYYEDAIYPAFVDNTNYEAWTIDGRRYIYKAYKRAFQIYLRYENRPFRHTVFLRLFTARL